MASRRVYAFLLFVAVAAAVLSMEGAVHAARDMPTPGRFDGGGYLSYPSVYERARASMACWLEKLASGPSPRGPGH
ncbi:hypothetical protein Taro_046672 [Colocasia esculenta]|uniref:Uncharacterized protein n=1 Tax=Colocasia esculenta TaxID=4460 RepID=A0A843X2R5_COLES|nr:hypothetical protein [Colocasia esculenta]